MNRSIRNDIASTVAALCPATFGTFLWLFSSYFSSRPKEPRPDLGLTQALNNHGAHVYLSNSESTGLALLMAAFLAGLLLTIVIVPKRFSPAPPGSPRWLAHVSGAFDTDLRNPSLRLKLIFLCSLALYVAVIFFAGKRIVDLLVSHRVVLRI
jgi:hypothetical protein